MYSETLLSPSHLFLDYLPTLSGRLIIFGNLYLFLCNIIIIPFIIPISLHHLTIL